MFFDVITLFPELFKPFTEYGVFGRSIQQKRIRLQCWQLRDFSDLPHQRIDDKPYGGGAGMVMQVAPIRKCIRAIKQQRPKTQVIYLSPQGQLLTPDHVQALSQCAELTLLCGRYQGVDERVIENDVDLELSIGNYILSGGELAALIVMEVLSRFCDGTLNNPDSLEQNFIQGLLSEPIYTRPEEIDGQCVPEILLSGHAAKIKAWQQQQAYLVTQKKRPDLLKKPSA